MCDPHGDSDCTFAFDFDGPVSAIIETCNNLKTRSPQLHFLNLDPFRHISTHLNMRILQQAWKLDETMAVSDSIRDQLRFLDRAFAEKDIQLFTPGVKVIECSSREKERCRNILLSYAKITWNLPLRPEKTVIATRVTRAVASKGLHRDLNLLFRCAKILQVQKRSALFLLITTWTASDNPTFDLITSLSDQAERLSEQAPNLHIRLINQYAWPQYPERGARPTGLSRDNLHRVTDLSIALSTYDSYNIAVLEPSSCGAICVLSRGCGAARRVVQLEGWANQFVIADFTAELLEARRAWIRRRHGHLGSPTPAGTDHDKGGNDDHEHDVEENGSSSVAGGMNVDNSDNENHISKHDLASKSTTTLLTNHEPNDDPIINQTDETNDNNNHTRTRLLESIFALQPEDKTAIESAVLDRTASALVARVPRTAADRGTGIAKGRAVAEQMAWKGEIERGLLKALRKFFGEESEEKVGGWRKSDAQKWGMRCIT